MKTPDFKIRDEGYYITFLFLTYRAYARFTQSVETSSLQAKYDDLRQSISLAPDDYMAMFKWIESEGLILDAVFV